ncbi:ATP-binding protein [Streptomyces sp. NBC_01476]|uniref:ATP-binding protein n=1 Tax=Streptomyces sp. NBC_01476 TaxID=2903881 RepID=UPI002E362FC4|nr:ATP-binding protein [Streptomyces sp. NBC_01476]
MKQAPPAAPMVVRSWPMDPRSVRDARQHLRGVLDRWDLGKLTDAAELVVSELVTNALQHADVPGRLIETRYQQTAEGGLDIEIHDADSRVPAVREAGPHDESGRGLTLVDTLTQGRWGVRSRAPREGAAAAGKFIWARVGPDPA